MNHLVGCLERPGRVAAQNGRCSPSQVSRLGEYLERVACAAGEMPGVHQAWVALGHRNGHPHAEPHFQAVGFPPSSEIPRLEQWLLEHPDQWQQLARGECVADAGVGLVRDGQRLLLFPILNESGPQALLCLEVSGTLPSKSLDACRDLCLNVAPVLPWMRELEELRIKNGEFVQRVGELETALEDLRQQKSQLEGLAQMGACLVSNIAHELRSPLVAVRGYAKLILEGQAGQISGVQREYLTVILENANRMVSSLKQASRLVADRELQLQSFDMLELWRESLDLIRSVAAKKSIRLVERFSTEPHILTGDREKLALVVHKLLSNAVRFTSPGGEIEVQLLQGEDQITARISDTGDGIPAELVERILGGPQRPVQGPSSGSEVEGAGIASVSVIHDIIGMHGGRVYVESALGKGWTVTLTLPVIELTGRRKVRESNEQPPCADSGR